MDLDSKDLTTLTTTASAASVYEKMVREAFEKLNRMASSPPLDLYRTLFAHLPHLFELVKQLHQDAADSPLSFKVKVNLVPAPAPAPAAAAAGGGSTPAAPPAAPPADASHTLVFVGYWNEKFICTKIERENAAGSATPRTVIATFA